MSGQQVNNNSKNQFTGSTSDPAAVVVVDRRPRRGTRCAGRQPGRAEEGEKANRTKEDHKRSNQKEAPRVKVAAEEKEK